jgi:putative membrane protein
MDYGLKYALIAAGAERAGGAQPYGSPEGATALTAYTYELAGANGAESANLTRGLAALAVLGACAGLAAIRRLLA